MVKISVCANLEAIVLAGGKGTRLRSVIYDRPKPMAPVAGRPFLEWLLQEVRRQGIQRVILATGDKVRHATFGEGIFDVVGVLFFEFG